MAYRILGKDVFQVRFSVGAPSVNSMIKTTYALQTFDGGNNQNITRFATSDRSELTKKCVTSFLQSVVYCANNVPTSHHVVYIIDDGSSKPTQDWLSSIVELYQQDNVIINLQLHKALGVMGSVRKCYEILKNAQTDLVYQVQDDYLFDRDIVFECIDMFMQIQRDLNTHAIISPYNDSNSWQTTYRYAVTPRMVVPGAKGYWIQMYDTSCSFLTSNIEFNKHWDLYEAFLNHPMDHRLEADTLNKMFVDRGVLGLMRFNSGALHLQSDLDKDPYIDWKAKWEAIVI
jgi:hypothetical protein